jgi:hypothetical protein
MPNPQGGQGQGGQGGKGGQVGQGQAKPATGAQPIRSNPGGGMPNPQKGGGNR